MTDPDAEFENNNGGKADLRRDLVPMIVILVFTIVMTIVAVTVWQLMEHHREAEQMTIPESTQLWLVAEDHFVHRRFSAAIPVYRKALAAIAREDQNGDGEYALMSFLIHLRLTGIFLQIQEIEQAEEHLKLALEQRNGVEQGLDGITNTLVLQLQQAKKMNSTERNEAAPAENRNDALPQEAKK